MDYSIARSNNLIGIVQFEIFVFFKYPINSLSYYLKITLNLPFGFDIGQVFPKNSWLIFIVTVNLID